MHTASGRILMDFASIELLILDVDGVLTDGGICLSGGGEQIMRFHVQDGCAIKLWQKIGGRVAVLSGRTCEALTIRAAELGIDLLRTGSDNKLAGYQKILDEAQCDDPAVAYMGDDLPDLSPMARAGLAVAVANALPAVKRAAGYVTRRSGGAGAVAEVVEFLLRKQQKWSPTSLSLL